MAPLACACAEAFTQAMAAMMSISFLEARREVHLEMRQGSMGPVLLEADRLTDDAVDLAGALLRLEAYLGAVRVSACTERSAEDWLHDISASTICPRYQSTYRDPRPMQATALKLWQGAPYSLSSEHIGCLCKLRQVHMACSSMLFLHTVTLWHCFSAVCCSLSMWHEGFCEQMPIGNVKDILGSVMSWAWVGVASWDWEYTCNAVNHMLSQ